MDRVDFHASFASPDARSDVRYSLTYLLRVSIDFADADDEDDEDDEGEECERGEEGYEGDEGEEGDEDAVAKDSQLYYYYLWILCCKSFEDAICGHCEASLTHSYNASLLRQNKLVALFVPCHTNSLCPFPLKGFWELVK